MNAVEYQLILDLRYLMQLIGENNNLTSKLAPGIAVFFSKSVAVPCGLYFEQLATKQQGGLQGLSRQSASRFDGLGFILGRELLFSVVFWTVNEQLYKLFKQYTTQVTATTASAMVSGLAGGLASYPMDALKTWKISFPGKFNNKSSIKVVQEIIAEKGSKFLFSGLYLRMARSSLGNTAFFYLYALCSKTLDNLASSSFELTH